MKLVSVTVCMRTYTVDMTEQDYMATICDTSLVGNSACEPSPCLARTCFPQTCLIPTDIKFSLICEKIDAVNKELTYVINVLAHIITLLSFLFFCVIVEELLTLFIGSQRR